MPGAQTYEVVRPIKGMPFAIGDVITAADLRNVQSFAKLGHVRKTLHIATTAAPSAAASEPASAAESLQDDTAALPAASRHYGPKGKHAGRG